MSCETQEEIEKIKEEIRALLAPLSPEVKYKIGFDLLGDTCEEAGWGDPFSYARSREIDMACTFGHQISSTLSGADAINQDGDEVEYKSTIGKSINATYNGISVQPSWEEQEQYLRAKKIGCYKEHYFARYAAGQIVEAWKASGEDVLRILLPKLVRRYHSLSYRKDPRLGANLSKTEIQKIGKRII
jgi:hypothetical protein